MCVVEQGFVRIHAVAQTHGNVLPCPMGAPGVVLHVRDRSARKDAGQYRIPVMSQQPDEREAEDASTSSTTAQQQQQTQATPEGHGGQGSDSAMKHMLAWEQRRARNSGGKHRQGPD